MAEGLRSIVALSKESLRSIEPSKDIGKPPVLEWVDPRSLFVEDGYQRNLAGENSTRQIRKMVAAFNWVEYAPPICVRVPEFGNVLVVIDGQHTATAAASHPDIPKIPVFVVQAAQQARRAQSFVNHNKNRIGLTQMAIYRAELAAGDPLATMMNRALKAAGAEILIKSISLRDKHPAGSTIAVATIRTLAKTQGEDRLARVLRILTMAGRGPIKADEIAAVAMLVIGKPIAIDDRVVALIASRSAERWAATAASVSADTNKSSSAALAMVWAQELGLAVSTSNLKPNKLGNATRAVATLPRPAPALPPPQKPVVAPRQIQPAPIEPTGAPDVVRNGVTVSLDSSKVTHRGQTAYLGDSGVRLVAALAKVMPSMLPYAYVDKQVFGVVDAGARLRCSQLVDKINPLLVKARLEIRTVSKMGHTLYDLGPAAA